MRWKIIGSLAIGVAAVFVFFFLVWPTLVIDLIAGTVTGDLYYFKGDVRQLTRRNEKLPVILFEGNTVYCRMSACDFRFPLPDNVRIVRTNINEGGFDTINGTIYVSTTNGAAVDLTTYFKRLADYHVAEGGSVQPAWVADTNRPYPIHFSYFGDY